VAVALLVQRGVEACDGLRLGVVLRGSSAGGEADRGGSNVHTSWLGTRGGDEPGRAAELALDRRRGARESLDRIWSGCVLEQRRRLLALLRGGRRLVNVVGVVGSKSMWLGKDSCADRGGV